MMIGKISSIVICLLLFLGAISEIAPAESQTIQTQIGDPISETYSEMDQIDLSGIDGYFTENLGQKGEGAGNFYALGNPLSVAFGESWVAYNLVSKDNSEGVLVKLTFEGANKVIPVGVSVIEHKSNFFIGNDPDKWHSNVRNYEEVWYYDLYKGIDLRYYFTNDNMKYEFHVDQGIDPSIIKIDYDGCKAIKIEESGNLEIINDIMSVYDEKPISFQQINDMRYYIDRHR